MRPWQPVLRVFRAPTVGDGTGPSRAFSGAAVAPGGVAGRSLDAVPLYQGGRSVGPAPGERPACT